MSIWHFIVQNIKEKHQVVLMVVLESRGSSPGRQGFKMAVSSSGEMFGSIGGGRMEYNLVEDCKKRLNKPFTPFIKHQVHRKQAPENQSGLNCSGEQTVAFYHLSENNFSYGAADIAPKSCFIASSTGVLFSDEKLNSQFIYSIQKDKEWELKENLKYKNTLYIVGGGHVSLAFSKLMKTLNFYIVVLDNRDELNTLIRNIYADETKIIDYNDVNSYIPEGNNIYVTVMSFGFATDEIVVKELLGKQVMYLGSMGSKAKIRKLTNKLKKEGAKTEDIDKLYAPIGLDINSQTPEEIAISIAAEIIKVKNESN